MSVDMATSSTSSFLLNCCDSDLRKDVSAATPGITTLTEDEVMAAIKTYAVQSRTECVLMKELLGMVQDQEEGIRRFYARVLNVARQCDLEIACTNNVCPNRNAPFLSYRDKIVKYVVLNGLYHADMQKEVFGSSNIDGKTLAETIDLIVDKEKAARSVGGRISAAAGMRDTAYGRQKKEKILATDKRLKETAKCETCGKMFPNQRIRTKNGADTLFKLKWCEPCWAEKKSSGRGRADKKESASAKIETEALATEAAEPYAFCGNYTPDEPENPVIAPRDGPRDSQVPEPRETSLCRDGGRNLYEFAASETLKAMSFDHDHGWVSKKEDHGYVKLSVYTDPADARAMGVTHREVRPTNMRAVADSGCQGSIMGPDQLHQLGLRQEDLYDIKSSSSNINGGAIEILGVLVLRLAAMDQVSGKIVETAAQVRVAPGIRRLYISKQVMESLGIINKNFPAVEAAGAAAEDDRAECGCLARKPAPPLPERLPFEPTESNTDQMKNWLLDRYGSSGFNKCQHQALPMMSCEPLRIHIDPSARPVAAMTARPVPVHFTKKVKEQLDEDVRLGVIERVPIGTPTTWQSRMHVVAKPNGEPRRTVDYRMLNKHCLREAEAVVSPFKQARMIPARVFKTKTDAWNGYHSCPLDIRDRDYTTFTTEFGRFRYMCAPQGFVASGDAYNQRYARLLDGTLRYTRCVDDVAMWDRDVEEHWWRVLTYLDMVAKNGIILSPEKFQFCAHEIDFAGFRVSDEEVKPLPKYLDAIQRFPRPENISDIRSWFGLVNQVSHYNQLVSMMAPFKKFLSPKVKFEWGQEMEDVFQRSKEAIIKAIVDGVAIFDPERTTALSTDYSTTGLGYFLYQKYCHCPSVVTTCCATGWRVTLAGSRFLHQAEVNYWPTQGEMLAVAWALHDTRYFTLGCRDLHVQTDHRALVKLLGDKRLEDIDDRRMVNLKEKTLPWHFSISWVPGTAIPAPDATSRRPQHSAGSGLPDVGTGAGTGLPDAGPENAVGRPPLDGFPIDMAALRVEAVDDDLADDVAFAAIGRKVAGEIEAVTWDRVQEATWLDRSMMELVDAISRGFNEAMVDRLPPNLAEYWKYREKLNVVDDVVMMGERVVIPVSLRQEVLDHLHGAHHGVSQMTALAQRTVFWPGILADIQKTRDKCRTCDSIAPSQRQTRPKEPAVPTYPFEMVCSDYFDLGGIHYLLTVDRFTNWVDVRRAKPHTDEASTGDPVTPMGFNNGRFEF